MGSASDPERLKRRDVLYGAARVLSEAERSAFLDAACSQDGELRAELEAMLRADDGDSSASDHQTQRRNVPAELGQLGPYRLLRPIGSGGMGVVYEAQDTRLERTVAVKVLWEMDLDNEDTSHERFLREARAASALEHPNICSIYDVGETGDGRFYMVMAYYDGDTLRDKLLAGPMPIDDACTIALQLAQGLKRAHASGIIHRDLKPANVMVTHGGEVKLLDFGLAKLAGVDSITKTGSRPGTPAYMAPEQVRDEQPIDGRADIWALGVVLYEMLAGRHPFRGEEPSATLHRILERDPVPLDEAREDVPDALARLVDKALAKDRRERYQSVGELLSDLEKGVPPKTAPNPHRPSRNRRPLWIAGAIAIVLASALGLWRFVTSHAPATSSRAAAVNGANRSLAVLQFQNLTGDASLEWLRNGLAEMLVTDLSQSPEIVVPSSARVYQSLVAHDMVENPSLTFDGIRRVAEDVGAQAVVRGSYARVGDLFRIAFTVEDADTGTILRSDRVEGQGEQSLFALMDEVSAAIRNSFEISRPVQSPPTLAAATTSSLEAWRLYTEGVALSWDFKNSEALVLFERAVTIDPNFALALAALGSTHSEMGHDAQAQDYLGRALALTDHLPLDDRFQIESIYYGARWRTFDRAIRTYEEGLAVYPDEVTWRNNLARRYAFHERYQDALEQFDRLIEEGSDFSGSYFDAANARAALGQFETGYRLVSQHAAAHPDEWFAQHGLGWFLTEWGKFGDADKSFDAAERLRPGEWSIPYARWRIAVLREDWQSAERYAGDTAAPTEPLARWRGAVSQARNALYRGKTSEALERFDQAIASYSEPNGYTALARCWKAELLLEIGEPARALEETLLARESGRDEWPERQALGIAVLAHQALGHSADADARLAELSQLWDGSARSNEVEERHELYIRGLLALSRNDAGTAVKSLRQAASLLPPRGVEFHWHVYPIHVPIWVALGESELAAGNTDAALSWFERAAESRSEHLEQPVPYVRSFYFLGRIHRQQGDPAKARPYFERFLQLWGEGDLDSERVRESRAR